MVLAIAALFLQFPAVAPSSLSKVSEAASIEESAPAGPADVEPVANAVASARVDRVPAAVFPASSDGQPESAIAMQPGRLTPTPVASDSSSAAADSTPLFSSSAATSAFVASSPASVRATRVEDREDRRKRVWLGLMMAQHSAATFDAWSTRRVISSGEGVELNPTLRPFAGNDSLYAAIQVAPLLFDYVSRRMMNSRYGWARHTWWMPQSLSTAVSVASGAHNLSIR